MRTQEIKRPDGMRKKRIPKIERIQEPIKIFKKRRPKPKINIEKLISQYLIHSYLYYEKQISVISDNEFDGIVDSLLLNFEKVEDAGHQHKHLVDKNALESYTGFGLIGKFPGIIRLAGLELAYPEKSIEKLIKEL